MFPENTYLKVIKHLNITIADAASVQIALDVAEQSPAIETEVASILAFIEDLAGKIATEQSSPNSAMTRADVVEWEGGGARTKGMYTALNNAKRLLANMLGLPWSPPSSGYSCGTISMGTRTIL